MKRFIYSFVLISLCFGAYAEDFYAGTTNYVESFSDDYVNIQNGAIVNSSSGGVIFIDSNGITINNDGIINANIDTNEKYFRIRNGGTINGNIIMYDACELTQIINSAADMHSLNIFGNHNVNVEMIGFSGMADLNQLKALNNVGSFQITNSGIVMDDFSEWQDWDANIEVNGVTLYVNNPETLHSGDVINHVNNASNINVVLLNSGDLYTITVQSVESGAILNVIRETDYDKVFDDEDTGFFKELQENNADDNLLRAMNMASNINELQSIMNSSYRFNHSILMRPVVAITNFSLVKIFDYDDSIGVRLSPGYVISDDFSGFELRADIGASYKDLYFDVGVFFNRFNYENGLNDFSGTVYGMDFKAKKYIDNFWVNGIVGFAFADFKADYVHTNNGIKNNPYGYALYGGIDGGYDYKVSDNFIISPFVGGVFRNQQVLDFSDTDINLRGGSNIKYAFAMDGIRYEYAAGGAIATNGDMFAMLKAGFVSVSDGAGAFVGLDISKDEYNVNYRASISGKITF